MTLNDLEPSKLGVLVIFLQFSVAAHTPSVNCNEMDGDSPGQLANRHCYRLSRVSWALLKLFIPKMWGGFLRTKSTMFATRELRT